jgi:CRP-like cAMP-binding protein
MLLSVADSFQNRILASLPPQDRNDVGQHLNPVALGLKQILHQPGAPISDVYFIEQGLASVLSNDANGAAVEVRMVGREGMTGFPYLLGAHSLRQRIIMQIPGIAWRMDAAQCKAEFDRREALRSAVLRYINTALSLTAQTAACNRLHSLEQRCARLLLNASDRLGSDTMPITHELLALMLGTRRAGVTETLCRVQRCGWIHYQRGRLTITNREALTASACGCYLVDREEFNWFSRSQTMRTS